MRWMMTCLCMRLAVGLCVQSAQATLMAPGSTQLAAPEVAPVGGTIVGGGVPVAFTEPTVSGTLTTTVYQNDSSNPLGGLTFTFLVQNDVSSPDEIGRFTVSGFKGWLTDVSFQVPTAGVQPTLQDRNTSGNVIGFDFIGLPFGAGMLAPGQTSALMVIQTNAPSFTPALAHVIDGFSVEVSSFAPIPEPLTVLGMLASAGSIGAYIRRRQIA